MQFSPVKAISSSLSIPLEVRLLDKVYIYLPLRVPSPIQFLFSELTDAIKEDWGGKPFVDMIRGWKYALENYPEVRGRFSCSFRSFPSRC